MNTGDDFEEDTHRQSIPDINKAGTNDVHIYKNGLLLLQCYMLLVSNLPCVFWRVAPIRRVVMWGLVAIN